jgi:hypothetical protein
MFLSETGGKKMYVYPVCFSNETEENLTASLFFGLYPAAFKRICQQFNLVISELLWPHRITTSSLYQRVSFAEERRQRERPLSPLPLSEILRITINLYDLSFPTHPLSYDPSNS